MARKLGVPQTAGAWNFIVPPGDAPIDEIVVAIGDTADITPDRPSSSYRGATGWIKAPLSIVSAWSACTSEFVFHRLITWSHSSLHKTSFIIAPHFFSIMINC